MIRRGHRKGRVGGVLPTGAICLIVVALAGCSDKSASDSAPDPSREKQATDRLTEETPQILKDSRAACEVIPRRKMARDFGLRTTDRATLAARFARGYNERVRTRVESACFEGLMKQP